MTSMTTVFVVRAAEQVETQVTSPSAPVHVESCILMRAPCGALIALAIPSSVCVHVLVHKQRRSEVRTFPHILLSLVSGVMESQSPCPELGMV